MTENNELLLDRLQQLLKQKKSLAFYANKLNLSIEATQELMRELRNKDKEEEDTGEESKEVNVEKGTVRSTKELTFDAQNIDQLYDLHKVDKALYKITNYWSKLKSNGKFTSSVLASLKKDVDYSNEDFSKFLENYKPKPVKVTISKTSFFPKNEVDVEISIADFHLDRRVLAGDTLEERKQEYRNIVNGLMNQVQGTYKVRNLIFVIGNDYFNTDNYHNQTTNLTPQEVTVPWHKAYEEGFDLLVEVITTLSNQAETVKVVLIQGNHDRTKSFYLAHALEVFFKSYTNIEFLRENSNTKFVVLGNTFVGYHHGNHIKIDGLPLYFATDEKSSASFGLSKYREVHTGDKHFYMAKDIQGVRIQQIPSMVKPDNFTNDGLWLHVKSGVAFCYDPIKGRCAEFECRL